MLSTGDRRPNGPSRRDLLRQSTLGFGALALADLLSREGLLASESRSRIQRSPSRVRSVVFFFVGGGPSHVDTFDPKPLLQQLDGKDVPESLARNVPTIARSPLNNLLASPWTFRPAGQCGLPVSELFPHLATCIDDLCILRSCRHNTPIHAPAEFLTFTGTPVGDRPSLGTWLTYGLGSDNQDLPGFIVFKTGETVRPAAMGPGFLPASYQGIFVDPQKGIAHTSLPPGLSNADRRRQLDLIGSLNRLHQARHPGQSDLEARIRAYELSYRMQARAPETFSLAGETKETLALYGCDQAETAEYGRILLLTRRLVERGVRFVQIRSGGWDAHADILGNHTKKCRQTDQPLAGFLKDLKRRGLFDETLVIWGGEFGRTPACQRGAAKPGRDHSPSGYTMWLAGGGIRGGQAIGATDPVGYAAIDRPIHPNDLHATLLHALGIDQHDLYFERHGRKEIVTVVNGEVVPEVFARSTTRN